MIVPSLPGFGFSDAPKDKGYGVAKMASIVNSLMVHLGYTKYSKYIYFSLVFFINSTS